MVYSDAQSPLPMFIGYIACGVLATLGLGALLGFFISFLKRKSKKAAVRNTSLSFVVLIVSVFGLLLTCVSSVFLYIELKHIVYLDVVDLHKLSYAYLYFTLLDCANHLAVAIIFVLIIVFRARVADTPVKCIFISALSIFEILIMIFVDLRLRIIPYDFRYTSAFAANVCLAAVFFSSVIKIRGASSYRGTTLADELGGSVMFVGDKKGLRADCGVRYETTATGRGYARKAKKPSERELRLEKRKIRCQEYMLRKFIDRY